MSERYGTPDEQIAAFKRWVWDEKISGTLLDLKYNDDPSRIYLYTAQLNFLADVLSWWEIDGK